MKIPEYKVLLIEDDEDDVLIIGDMLAESRTTVYNLTYTDRLGIGLEYIASEPFDIVLLDLNLPDSIGLDTLKNLISKTTEIPVIVLTGLDDEETGLNAVNVGAQDYLVKGAFKINELNRSIRYAIERHHLIIEQKQAEKAIQISAQQWQTTFDAMSDAISLISAEGKIIRANKAMSDLLKMPCDELVGKTCYELVHGVSKQPDNCPLRKMLETHVKKSTTLFMDHRWFDAHVDPLIDEEDNIIGAVHIMSDITERKQMEDNLRIINRSLRVLSECNQVLIRSVDEDELLNNMCQIIVKHGGYHRAWITYVNENKLYETKTGYGDNYKEVANIICSENDGPFDIVIQTHKPFIANDILTNPDFAYLHDKALKYEFNSFVCLPLINGIKVFGILFICSSESSMFDTNELDLLTELSKDIAYGVMSIRIGIQHKKMEEALIESEKKYRELVENLNEVILTLDMEGRITYVNSAARQIFGYSINDLIGKHFKKFIFSDDIINLLANYDNILNNISKPIEIRILDKDKKIHYVLISNRPTIENGNLTGITILLTDITEQKQLEEQFRQAQKMEAVGLLAGGIAHDFNNLLQTITGYSEFMLFRLDDNNPIKKYAGEIQKAGERAASLTRQLLAFSRKQILQQKILSINDLINDMIKMLNRLIGEDIELVTDLAPDLLSVKADPGQIEQIIMNLIINARDAMPKGGKLMIKTKNVSISEEQKHISLEAQSGDFICLSISDTGVGINKNDIHHIFEPFFSTKGIKGTGLGLAVVYGIVKQHGGWIDVYSEIGKGSIFEIYLPIVTAINESKMEEIKTFSDFYGNKEKILLIEDESQVREFVAQVLQEHGYLICKASCMEEAIEIFKKESGNFHLIFSDVVLKDGSGIELIDKLLNIKSDVRVLLSSGYTDQKSQWAVINDKGYLFIQKPYTIIDLLKTVKIAIEKGK